MLEWFIKIVQIFLPWLKNKYGKKFLLDIDFKQILFSRIDYSRNINLDGRLCLVFHNINISNIGEKPTTLKSLNLIYKCEKEYEADSLVVPTTTLETGKTVIMLRCEKANANIVVVWDHIRLMLEKKQITPVNGVISGSAVFVLKHGVKVEDIENITLVIKDFAGNCKTQSFPIDPKWTQNLEYSVVHARLEQKENGLAIAAN